MLQRLYLTAGLHALMIGGVEKPTFRARFCQEFGCADSEYEEKALEKCLYSHARLAAPLLRRVLPDFFSKDLDFVRDLGNATDRWSARGEVLTFKENFCNDSFLRQTLRLRASGRKAAALAFALLNSE